MGDNGSIDHTADLILEFTGADLEEIFRATAAGMLGTITPLEGVGEKVEERIHLEAPNPGELLVCWLNELIFFLDSRGLLLVRYDFKVLSCCGEQGRATHMGEEPDRCELIARAFGEEIDLSKREVGTEIKAATYHDIYLRKEGDAWRARILFDI